MCSCYVCGRFPFFLPSSFMILTSKSSAAETIASLGSFILAYCRSLRVGNIQRWTPPPIMPHPLGSFLSLPHFNNQPTLLLLVCISIIIYAVHCISDDEHNTTSPHTTFTLITPERFLLAWAYEGLFYDSLAMRIILHPATRLSVANLLFHANIIHKKSKILAPLQR